MTVQTFEVEAAGYGAEVDLEGVKTHYLIRIAADGHVGFIEAHSEPAVHGIAADHIATMLDIPIDQVAVAVSFYESVPESWEKQ